MNRIKLRDVKTKGFRARQAERAEGETTSYRGGNSGALMDDGTPAGSCVRKVLAREVGYNDEATLSKDLMFQFGFKNEEIWNEDLNRGLPEGYEARSADGEVEWTTSDGTKVTGSPDTIIFNEKDEAVHLIEHKSCASLWTFRSTILERKPKFTHITQAAHYAWALGIENFDLVYTSLVNFTGPSFATNIFPAPGEEGSEHLEYTYYEKSNEVYSRGKNKGKPKNRKVEIDPYDRDMLTPAQIKHYYRSVTTAEFKNTRPAFAVFELRWNDEGYVEYKHEEEAEWTETPISAENIKAFYEGADKAKSTKRLPPRPVNLEADGELNEGFSLCDYCTLKATCNTYEGQYERWLDEVKRLAKGD